MSEATCQFCHGPIRFRMISGTVVPMHDGDYQCLTYARNGQPDECWRTTCPRCHKPVFFVRHNDGAVWFDELGEPWEKHACFADTSPPPQAKRFSDYLVLVRIRKVKPLLKEEGFAVAYGRDRKGSDVVDVMVEKGPPMEERTILNRKDHLRIQNRWVYLDHARSCFVTLDGRVLPFRPHRSAGGWKI